jgi:hypothetical protein
VLIIEQLFSFTIICDRIKLYVSTNGLRFVSFIVLDVYACANTNSRQSQILFFYFQNGQVRIWRKTILPKGSYAIAIFYTNISGGPAKVSIRLSDIGIVSAAQYTMTETISGRSIGIYRPWYTLNIEINPTGVVLIDASAIPPSKI